MLVTRTNFAEVLARLELPGRYALDTETTGLSAYKGDRLFSIIIATLTESWYFNFNRYPDLPDDQLLLRSHKDALQASVFSRLDHEWELHNAKFDLHMLGVEGLTLAGSVWCSYAMGRVLHNDLRAYNMDFLSQRWLGESKSDLVKEYADEHGLFETYMKGRVKKKNYFFAKVPLHIVQEYAEKDGLLTAKLAAFERDRIRNLDAHYRKPNQPPLWQVVENEMALTKVLYEIEKVGVLLDKPYAEAALKAETTRKTKAAEAFKQLADIDFEDSPTVIGAAFKKFGVQLPKGDGGRLLTNKEVLATVEHPAARLIEDYRTAQKKAVTYYGNFLAMADSTSVIHPDFHQGGTKTGRLSCRDPNLQNLERPDEDADAEAKDTFTVRRAFVPREDFCFFAPDYDQIEYRLMLEYADEDSVIARVLSGLDVHSATAESLGVSRFQAKTINFMLIYGGGNGKLASSLKCSWEEAKAKRALYFEKLPKIARFVELVRAVAYERLTLHNWFGRRYTFAFPDMTYTTAPNWLIQGGCSEVLKKALILTHAYLKEHCTHSRIVLNVHDEIVFEMHKSELHHCRALVEIMETVYPFKKLKLTAGPAYSWKSLADKVDGYPELPGA